MEIIINGDDQKLLSVVPEERPVTIFGLDNTKDRPQYESFDTPIEPNKSSSFIAQNIQPYQNGVTKFDIKTQNENFPTEAFKSLGYYSYVFGQKSYNGVAFLSKNKIENIS